MPRWLALTLLTGAIAPRVHAATDDEMPDPTRPSSAPRVQPPAAEPGDVEYSPPRRSAVYFVMGAGTPVGFVGFEGIRRIGSVFELSAAVGRGFAAMDSQKNPSPVHDVQWAVMPRLRAGGRKHALTLGAGLSGGNSGPGNEWFCDNGPCPKYDRPLTYVVWANFEIGTEHWWDSGFALRTFMGYARGCSWDSCTTAGGLALAIPYFGLGVGYAF